MPEFKLTESSQKIIKKRLEDITKELSEIEREWNDYQHMLNSLGEKKEGLLCEEAVLMEALKKFK